MENYLKHLQQGSTLTSAQAQEVIEYLASGECPEAQIGAYLMAFNMRPVEPVELSGFRQALLKLALPLKFKQPVLDLCGTGGDGKDTFNISTLTAFVLAGAGIAVAKHGNYSVSSSCGSSNILEAIGVRFSNDQTQLQKQLDQCNLCFLHAPIFHPAMKAVAPARKALGLKTIFNLLGPICNPAQPAHQLSGVATYSMLRLYSQVLRNENLNYAVLHTLDGYDEISLTADCQISSSKGEFVLSPKDFGLRHVHPKELNSGGSLNEKAELFKTILSGQGTAAQQAVVAANAAVAIWLVENLDFPAAFEKAQASLAGPAWQTYERLIALQA